MVLAPHVVVAQPTLGLPRAASPRSELPVNANDLGIGVLFDRLLDAVIVARLASGRIVLWNKAAEKLFGYTAHEAIGRPIEMLMPDGLAGVHRAGIERYRRTGHGLFIDADAPVEMPAVTRSGDELRVELTLGELRSRAGEQFALALMHDVTHRRQLELTNLELIQTRVAQSDLEAALTERDELLEATGTLLQADPGPDELRSLTNALGTVLRLATGDLRPFRQSAELVDIVHAACDAARTRAPGRRLQVYVPPTAPASLDVDWTRQVLDSVLDAAMQHAPEGGRIVVCLEAVSPQVVQVSVQAEGPAEQRAPDIGLQVSRSLMRHQGGGLSVAASPSGSLQVIMTLPGSPQPPKRRPSRPRGSAHALTVS